MSATTVVVLHGYGADENDLVSIFERWPELTIISLRAPIVLPFGGFAWYHLEQSVQGLKPDDASRKLSEELVLRELPVMLSEAGGSADNFIMAGFSQGTAMCYSMLARYDLQSMGLMPQRLIAMSGYVPRDVLDLLRARDLSGLDCFLSHGEFDELVPAIAMDEAETLLKHCGAKVEAHLYDIGHGLSQETLDDLERWLK